jgi:hypothetical protein
MALAYLKRGANINTVVSEQGTAFSVRELHQKNAVSSTE